MLPTRSPQLPTCVAAWGRMASASCCSTCTTWGWEAAQVWPACRLAKLGAPAAAAMRRLGSVTCEDTMSPKGLVIWVEETRTLATEAIPLFHRNGQP
jgi:hypothetical protein